MGGTPRIIFRAGHHSVMRGILVHVFQAGIIRFRKRDLAVEELEPHFTPRRPVLAVEFPGRKGVQLGEHRFQRGGFSRRGRHEMIVIGKHGPGVERPAGLLGARKQQIREEIQPGLAGKPMFFSVGARRDHVGAGLGQAVGRGVGPAVHGLLVLQEGAGVKPPEGKAASSRRTPKPMRPAAVYGQRGSTAK